MTAIPDKKRILYLYPQAFLGPEFTVFGHIMRTIDRSRFAMYVAIDSDAEDTPGLSELEDVRVTRWKFGMPPNGKPSEVMRAGPPLITSLLPLARYIRKEKIDIIQCVEARGTSMIGLVLARSTGAALLMHYHTVPGRYTGIGRILYAGRRVDHAVTVSEFIAGRVAGSGLDAGKIDVVVNGVDCTKFHPDNDGSAIRAQYGIAPSAPLVLQLARFFKGKRQEDVVCAFALARQHAPELRCLLVGWDEPRYQGPFASYAAELRHLRAEEALGESLIIAPARPEATQLLAAADIVVLPSIDDPCPLVVLEAMATGKPVIGAKSGGIPEMIVHGETGLLVEPRSPALLAESIISLVQDRGWRERMGQAGRRRAVEHFDESRVGSEFASIYEAMCTGRGRVTAARKAVAGDR